MLPTIKKNIAIVCNPLAGAGRADLFAQKLCESLSEKSIAFTLFNAVWPDHFTNFTDVFVVGGDGTLHYFINRYPGIQLPLVIFNAGTGNDFHWLLFGNKTLDEQIQIALHQNPTPIDVGKCNGRYFINGVGIGFEGAVARTLAGKKKFSGKTSFLICILKKIITYRSKQYSLEWGEQHINGKKLLIDISNGSRAGGGFHIAPNAKADDGLFDIVIADAMNPVQRLQYLPVIEKGKHLHLPFITHFQAQTIIINSDEPIQYHLDGEYFEAPELSIEILPAFLNFRF